MSYEPSRNRSPSKIQATDANNEVVGLSTTGTGDVVLKNGATLLSAAVQLAADPTSSMDAATMRYVQALATASDLKSSVRVMTTAALPSVTYSAGVLTATANGALTAQDGVTLIVSNRILVKDQASALQNGIYTVTAIGDGSNPFVLTRAEDADNSPAGEVTSGMLTFAEEGTTYVGQGFVLVTANPITLGSSALNFSQFSGSGVSLIAGDGLYQAGNNFHVGTANVARIVVNANDIDLASSGVTPGTYTKITVDTYGRATVGALLNSSDVTTALTFTPLKNTTDTLTGDLTITGLSASLPVFTDGIKKLVSNAVTGSGNVVMSASPTLTGTIGAAALTLSSTLILNGLTASTALALDGSKNVVSITNTGSGNNVLAVSPTLTGSVLIGASGTLTLDSDPTSALHAATKQYVDAIATGLDVKKSVRVATTANINLSSAPSAIDSVTLSSGNRVLVKDQTDPIENGIYDFNGAASAMTRSSDADNTPSNEVTAGMFTFVAEGTVNANFGYSLITDDPITLGSTSLTFSQFSGAGAFTAGNGLTQTGNQIDVVGTADRITANSNNIDIASTYAGQATIATLGTVTTGTWNGSTIPVLYGGTGVTTSTGSGNNVLSASPTFTGTIGAASMTLSGSLTIGTTSLHTGVATFTAQPIVSSLTASLPIFSDGSKGLVSNAMTGTGSVVMSASPTLTGTIAGANQTLSGTLDITGVMTLVTNPIFSWLGVNKIPFQNTTAPSGGVTSSSNLTYTSGTSTFATANGTFSGTLAVIGVTKLGTGTSSYTTKQLTIIGNSFDSTTLQLENTDVTLDVNGRNFNFGITDVSATEGRLDLTQPGVRNVMSVFKTGNMSIGTSTTDGGEVLQVNGTSRFTAAATMASTLTVSGATTLTGRVGIGTAPGSQASLEVQNTSNAGTTQYGIVSQVLFGTGATNTGINLYSQFRASGAFTMGSGRSMYIAAPSITTTTVTELVGLEIAAQAGGGTNYAIKTSTGNVALGDNVFSTGSGTGYWINSVGTFTYGMYASGGSLIFRSGSTSAALTFNSSGQPTFANAATFSGAVTMASSLTAVGSIVGNQSGSGTSSAFYASAAAPTITMVVSGAAADTKNWDIQGAATTLSFRTRTDANASGVDWLVATRSGTAVSSVAINSTLTVNSDTTSSAWGLSAITSSSGNGIQSLDNVRDHASNIFRIRMRTAGTPVTALSIDGGGTVTASVALVSSGTLAVTGNTTLSGMVGIGAASTTDSAICVQSAALSGVTQYGVFSRAIFTSGATTSGAAGYFRARTAVASFTMASGIGIQIDDATKGAGSTITTLYGLKIEDQTAGGTNYAIHTGSGTTSLGGAVTMSSASATFAMGVGAQSDTALYVSEFVTGLTATTQYGILSRPTFSTAATTSGRAGQFQLRTVASAFTMTTGVGVFIADASKGAGSTITTQYGLRIDDQTAGGTNYSIYTGTGKVRFGDIVSIGGNSGTNVALDILCSTLSGGTSQYGIASEPTFQSSATSSGTAIYGQVRTQATAFTMTQGRGLSIDSASKGAGSTITNLYGVYIEDQTAGATNWAIKTGAGKVELGDILKLIASSTSRATLNIPSGTAPTSPVDGDMWYDGTNLKFRNGGTTRTITWT